MPPPALAVTGLTKQYGHRAAVRDLHFEIPVGETCGLLGPNGSGKTTTLGLLAGTVRPTSGEVVRHVPDGGRAIGAAIGSPGFYPYLTGFENLSIAARLLDGCDRGEIERVLVAVDLWNRRGSRVSAYSLGMKQRLALAAALLGDPKVLLLDEPATGLDPRGVVRVRDLVRQLAGQGKTILLSSHMLGEVERVCGRVLLLKEGRMVADERMTALHSSRVVLTSSNRKLPSVAKLFSGTLDLLEGTGDAVTVTLRDDVRLEDLTRHLCAHGVFLSRLARADDDLEVLFMRLTRSDK